MEPDPEQSYQQQEEEEDHGMTFQVQRTDGGDSVMMEEEENTAMTSPEHQRQREEQQRQQQEQQQEGGFQRRNSMTDTEAKERRASIKAIMSDSTKTPTERRRSIQYLMDGRRNSNPGQQANASSSTCSLATNGAANSARRMEESRPECPHYNRKCTIISPCCGAPFGCRICHDDCPVLPPARYGAHASQQQGQGQGSGNHNLMASAGGNMQGTAQQAPGGSYARSSSLPASWTSMPEPEHHNIDRFDIREVICRECYTRQSSKTNECINCHVQFGEYHCDTCNLWMDAGEQPYHCKDCGFCRVGGRENFRHCFNCGMCIDNYAFAEHNCKVGKYMSNCPVCQEDLFSSRSASHEMPCGHSIHWHCFQQLANHDSRCPICKKTAESAERMASTWAAIARDIQMQPLPPEWAKVVNISCNDCEERDFGRRWHFLGVQCQRCNSFNTSVDKITMVGQEAAEFLEAVDIYRRMHS